MPANSDVLEYPQPPHLAGHAGRVPATAEKGRADGEEASCTAFGFLRGLRERALMVEFRLRDGNTEAFPYSWLGPVRFNPSVGLLLRFTGDVVTLVLIRGSNLDALVSEGAINLTDRGIHRHRILWVREMEEDEVQKAGKGEPTIDRLEIAEFESHADLKEWLRKTAPVLLR